MSEIVVRPYEAADQEATFQVRAMTYNSGRPIPLEEQVYKTSTPYVAELDGHIVGTFVVMPMSCTRGEVAVKAGGIAGVAVLPEARHSGVGAAMMRWALGHMRSEGMVIASLYAFRESFYRRFGYEVCGTRYKVTLPNSRFPRLKPSLPVRRLAHDQQGEIDACYTQFAHARSGMNLREPFHWGRILNPNKWIYVAGDPVEAFAIVEHQWDFWIDQVVQDIGWTSMRGYESILSTLEGIAINKTSLNWYEPSDGPFMHRYLDQGTSVQVERPVMYRMLDVTKALEALSPEHSGSFTIQVEDPDMSQNNTAFSVEFGNGKVHVSMAERASMKMSAARFVQAFLGEPSLERLAAVGAVQADDAQELAAACRLLPPMPVYCSDFF